MQKFGRLALILAGALLVLVAVVFIALNLYVQSQGTQARIEQELRHRFGTELKIGRISVTPWSGLKLSNITIAQGPGGRSDNFLEAKNFVLRVAFFSLFSRKLIIKEVSLINPNVIWPQNDDGKWRLPNLRGDKSPKPAAPAEANVPPPPENATPPSAELTTPIADNTPPPRSDRKRVAPAFASEIHKLSLIDGNFRFLGRANDTIANFENVRFRASISSAMALHGNARVGKVSLRDKFFLAELRSPLRYGDEGLDLTQIAAHVGGGELSGRFTMQPETDESPFHIEMKFHGVQADQVISEAGGPSGVLEGKLEGSLQAEGKTTDPDALAGSGEVFLHDGQLRQYNLLVALGQIFQIEELTQLHLDQAEAKYHLAPGVVTIDELVLRSPNIRLSATGTVSFRGKLHLKSRLAINEKIREQLFKPIRTNFQATEDPGYSAVDFEITGTLDRPKTNLLEKVVGRDLKDLVNSFWGGGKAEKPKKKKDKGARKEEESAPSPEPSESAPVPSPATTP